MKLKILTDSLREIKKAKDKEKLAETVASVKSIQAELKAARANSKSLSDEFASFNRAAKPYIDAKNLLTQSKNYLKLDEISSVYEAAKERHEKAQAEAAAEAERIKAEEKAYGEKLKAEKAAKKAAKKSKK